MKVRLYKTDTDNGQTGNIQQKDDFNLICEINGMLVDDDIYARKFSEDIVDRICKRLSLVFIKHNGNRHLYGLSTLFQTTSLRLFCLYCTGI